MILGSIIGKVSTNEFSFLVKTRAEKFQYVQVVHKDDYYVLAQITEVEKDHEKTIASCRVLGYRENSSLKNLTTPLDPGAEVLEAGDDFISEALGLQNQNGAFVGILNGRKNLRVHLDINNLLSRHIAIIAKSGSGKSYCCGVLIEELLEREIPVLIIDPHGEYSSLKQKSSNKEKLAMFGIEAKSYKNIQEYGLSSEFKILKLNKSNLQPSELIHLLPAKLSNNQLGCLYSVLKNLGSEVDFDELLLELENSDNNIKWTLISIIDYLKRLDLFSDQSTGMQDLIQPKTATILNLKGVNQDIQEIIVYKLVKDLFMERKRGNIPPFFMVLEESQNFCPERSFGEAKSSLILRQVFSEGRKFGFGLCLVSQRPARVDKTVLSQVTTNIILKVTNSNDVRAVINSVESLTPETERELQNLPVGTALVTGVVDMPLLVNIRPRKSMHGGQAIDIMEKSPVEEDGVDGGELLPIITQKISANDFKLIHNKDPTVELVPCLFLSCRQYGTDFNLLINLNVKELVKDPENASGIKLDLPKLELSSQQNRILRIAIGMKEFKASGLFSKSGMQFSDVYDVVTTLASKGIFINSGDSYRLNDSFSLFSNLGEYSFYDKPDFLKIKYNKKLEKKHSASEIVNFLKMFLDIKNARDCWLVMYS